jgi:hypothetical protein
LLLVHDRLAASRTATHQPGCPIGAKLPDVLPNGWKEKLLSETRAMQTQHGEKNFSMGIFLFILFYLFFVSRSSCSLFLSHSPQHRVCPRSSESSFIVSDPVSKLAMATGEPRQLKAAAVARAWHWKRPLRSDVRPDAPAERRLSILGGGMPLN